MSQDDKIQDNTTQHKYNTSSNTSQRNTTREQHNATQHNTTRVQHDTTRDNMSKKQDTTRQR